jgi:hypothetical protein
MRQLSPANPWARLVPYGTNLAFNAAFTHAYANKRTSFTNA